MLTDKITRKIDWDKLRTFYFVAKLGSFSRAAAYFHLSQSSLSRTIQSLEDRLECQLFFRTSKGLHLTQKGQIVFEWVTGLFESIDLMEQKLQREANELKGTLRVSTTHALAAAWLVFLVPEFMKLYPELTLSVIGSDRELDLSLREADVLIQPYIPEGRDYAYTLLMSWHLKLYASPSYLQELGMPETVEDLKKHRLLSFGDRIIFPYQGIDWLLRLGLPEEERHNPYFQINSSHGLLAAAESGMGIISFSEESPLLKNAKVVPVLSQVHGPVIDAYFIYPKEYESLKKVQAFLSYLKEKIAQEHKPIK